jgi:hypothetical protein
MRDVGGAREENRAEYRVLSKVEELAGPSTQYSIPSTWQAFLVSTQYSVRSTQYAFFFFSSPSINSLGPVRGSD